MWTPEARSTTWTHVKSGTQLEPMCTLTVASGSSMSGWASQHWSGTDVVRYLNVPVVAVEAAVLDHVDVEGAADDDHGLLIRLALRRSSLDERHVFWSRVDRK